MENTVVVEIKAVDAITPVHLAQLITFLKLSGKYVGLLMNFNVVHLRTGFAGWCTVNHPLCPPCPLWLNPWLPPEHGLAGGSSFI